MKEKHQEAFSFVFKVSRFLDRGYSWARLYRAGYHMQINFLQPGTSNITFALFKMKHESRQNILENLETNLKTGRSSFEYSNCSLCENADRAIPYFSLIYFLSGRPEVYLESKNIDSGQKIHQVPYLVRTRLELHFSSCSVSLPQPEHVNLCSPSLCLEINNTQNILK